MRKIYRLIVVGCAGTFLHSMIASAASPASGAGASSVFNRYQRNGNGNDDSEIESNINLPQQIKIENPHPQYSPLPSPSKPKKRRSETARARRPVPYSSKDRSTRSSSSARSDFPPATPIECMSPRYGGRGRRCSGAGLEVGEVTIVVDERPPLSYSDRSRAPSPEARYWRPDQAEHSGSWKGKEKADDYFLESNDYGHGISEDDYVGYGESWPPRLGESSTSVPRHSLSIYPLSFPQHSMEMDANVDIDMESDAEIQFPIEIEMDDGYDGDTCRSPFTSRSLDSDAGFFKTHVTPGLTSPSGAGGTLQKRKRHAVAIEDASSFDTSALFAALNKISAETQSD